MKKHITWNIGIWLIWFGLHASSEWIDWWLTSGPPRISPETTVVEGPLDDEGFVDYLAALNARRAETVTPENNAAIAFVRHAYDELSPLEEVNEPAFLEQLGIEKPDSKQLQFVNAFKFASAKIENEIGNKYEPNSDDAMVDEKIYELVNRLNVERPWAEEEHPFLAEWLQINKPTLDRLKQSLDLAHFFLPIVREEDEVFATQYYSGAFVDFAEQFKFRCLHHIYHQNFEMALSELLAIRKLGNHLLNNCTIDERFSGIGIHHIAFELERQLCSQDWLTRQDLESAIDTLKTADPPDNISLTIDRHDRLLFLWAAQLYRRQGKIGMTDTYPEKNVEGSLENVNYNEMLRRTNTTIDRFIESFRKEEWNRQSAIEQAIKPIEQVEKSVFSNIQYLLPVMTRRQRARFFAELLFAFENPTSGCLLDIRCRVEHDLTMIRLALLKYRIANARFPESLADLVPGYLSKLPIDRYDGNPIRYQNQDDKIIVYSGYRDGNDNQGKVLDPWNEDVNHRNGSSIDFGFSIDRN